MRIAPAIELTDEQEAELARLVYSECTSVRLAQRAQIVLLAAQGLQNKQIARQLGIGRVQVARWRGRYLESGLRGIERDLPRGAPLVKVDVAKLVELTTQSKPEAATHWSTRKMAEVLDVSPSTVMRHWQANGLKPHLVRGFKISREPWCAEQLEDIVGLYMSPSEHAIVLCCDDGNPVQALDRPQPCMPMKKGRTQRMPNDDRQYDRTTPFAAPHVLDGQVIGQGQQRRTYAEWLKFLRKIDRETPKEKSLHLIADNYATHEHPVVQAWLNRHPRFNMSFTPSSASWLKMVERFLRDTAVDRLRRGALTSVPELTAAIDGYVAQHSANPKPFIWTKCVADSLQEVTRANVCSCSNQNATLH